ncbi:unnamed protein product [Urochloa humidicola]
MEGLLEPLLAKIIKRVTRTSDLNSLSLVPKQLCNADAEERGTICVLAAVFTLQQKPCHHCASSFLTCGK